MTAPFEPHRAHWRGGFGRDRNDHSCERGVLAYSNDDALPKNIFDHINVKRLIA